jgi:dTDP-4-dehydrorhamnose 3,5-epimerase
MKFTETRLKNAFLIETEPRKDERGFFLRTFCSREFAGYGLRTNMVQSNLSHSVSKFTLRGMHYQSDGAEEAKLVRCSRGRIWDVIIDLRPGSPTYCQHQGFELSGENNLMLYVPEGFAHGFITLVDNSEVFYQVSNFYDPSREHGVRWNDKIFGIEWPTTRPVISAKDSAHPDYVPLKRT